MHTSIITFENKGYRGTKASELLIKTSKQTIAVDAALAVELTDENKLKLAKLISGDAHKTQMVATEND